MIHQSNSLNLERALLEDFRIHGAALRKHVEAVSVGPFGEAFLRGDITERRLAYFELLPQLDPAVAALHGSLSESTDIAEAVSSLISLLRAHGVFNEDQFRFPPDIGIKSIVRRLQKMVDAIPACPPRFVPPGRWQIIDSIGSLRSAGYDFENCLRFRQNFGLTHWMELITGSHVFLINPRKRLLVSLRHFGCDIWCVDQLTQSSERHVTSAERIEVQREFRASGIKIMSMMPQRAFAHLDAESNTAHDGLEDCAADLEAAIESMELE